MKNFVKFFLITILIPIGAIAAEPQKLECNAGDVCLEKDVSAGKYDFTITPASIVKIEVKGTNGVEIITTTNATAASSAMQIGKDVIQDTVLEIQVPQDGKFAFEIRPVKMFINGKELDASKAVYKLKIIRIGSKISGDVI